MNPLPPPGPPLCTSTIPPWRCARLGVSGLGSYVGAIAKDLDKPGDAGVMVLKARQDAVAKHATAVLGHVPAIVLGPANLAGNLDLVLIRRAPDLLE